MDGPGPSPRQTDQATEAAPIPGPGDTETPRAANDPAAVKYQRYDWGSPVMALTRHWWRARPGDPMGQHWPYADDKPDGRLTAVSIGMVVNGQAGRVAAGPILLSRSGGDWTVTGPVVRRTSPEWTNIDVVFAMKEEHAKH